MLDEKVRASRLKRTKLIAVTKHILGPCARITHKKNWRWPIFFFADETTNKAGEISYFGKH